MDILQVGERVPPTIMYFSEGAHLAVGDDGVLTVILMYQRPTQTEIADMSAGAKLQYNYLYKDGLLVLLLKPGNQQWIECIYKPVLDGQSKLPHDIPEGMGLSVHLLLIDKATSILKVQRLIGLGHRFSTDFIASAAESDRTITTPDEWILKTQQLQRSWNTKQLVKMSVRGGQIPG